MMAAAVAPLTWGKIQLLPEQAREIKFIFEARLRGNFLDGELAFSEQIAGGDQPKFQEILVRAQARVRGECMAEPTITDAKLARQ